MRWTAILAVSAIFIGCTAKQPESIKPVAAFEVPLPSDADRKQFLSVLRTAAEVQGMHVDAVSSADLEAMSKEMPPVARKTLDAAVWRGVKDDEPVADATDAYDHLGQIWIVFLKGTDPALNSRFRESAMREITLRWPRTLSLPIMPSGTIPLSRDPLRTPNGYVLKPSQEDRYHPPDTEKTPR